MKKPQRRTGPIRRGNVGMGAKTNAWVKLASFESIPKEIGTTHILPIESGGIQWQGAKGEWVTFE